MSGQLPSATKRPLYFAVILAFSLILTGLLFKSGVTGYFDWVLYDRCIDSRVKSGETKERLIATVDLNDASIKTMGEQIDTRQAFADIVDVLAQSNASIVFDFMFRYEKQNDAAFISAVESAGDTIIAALAVTGALENQPYDPLDDTQRQMLRRHVWNIKVLKKGKVPEASTFLLPLYPLGEAAAQIAHINMAPDSDGKYRQVHLLYKWEEGYIPSLALAAVVLYLRIPVETIELKAGEYLALPLSEKEVIRIPIDEQGRMLVPYSETYKDDRTSFSQVIDAKDNPHASEEVRTKMSGRIVLAAEISVDGKDNGSTSFEPVYPLSGVHAEIMGAMLDGFEKRAFISRSSLWYKITVLILLLSLAFLCSYARKETLFHLGFLADLLVFSCLTLYRWQNLAISPWYAFPVTLLLLVWLSEFLIRLWQRFREQLLMRNALSRYLPHALAERIMRERKTELVPAYKELTILFSDISGFTKWSSDKNPEQVHGFLSDYLESMAGIIFSHGGTVDKFMGDGILSFFGDPFDMPNHTEQCIKAAIAMQEKIKILAVKWKPIVDIDLKVRIGINTGKVIVGNLGSKTRIEYTVIGAAVNLAQRMESNAPVGGILVTANVREKVKDKFTFPERRDVNVKGYTETIEAYVVGN